MGLAQLKATLPWLSQNYRSLWGRALLEDPDAAGRYT